MKILPVLSKLFHTMEGQTDKTKLTVAFHNSAKATEISTYTSRII